MATTYYYKILPSAIHETLGTYNKRSMLLKRLAPASPALKMCCCSHLFFAVTSDSLPGLPAAKTDRGGLSPEAAPKPINHHREALANPTADCRWEKRIHDGSLSEPKHCPPSVVSNVCMCMSVYPPVATRENIDMTSGCIYLGVETRLNH